MGKKVHIFSCFLLIAQILRTIRGGKLIIDIQHPKKHKPTRYQNYSRIYWVGLPNYYMQKIIRSSYFRIQNKNTNSLRNLPIFF